jgi:16S rRNA processing protein RimM
VPEPTVVVGTITRAHGLHGEVSVLVTSDNPDRFETGSVLYTEDGRELRIRSARGHGRLLVSFEGIDDRNEAELLRGAVLVVPLSMLPRLPAGEYWPHELEECDVVTEGGRLLGTITDVVPNPGNDLWVATDEAGTETLLPAIRDVVIEVDMVAKRVIVREIAGLTVPDE